MNFSDTTSTMNETTRPRRMKIEFTSAMIGALLGLAVGLAIGWAQRSPDHSSLDFLAWLYGIIGANIGLLLGGLVGAVIAKRG